MVKKASVSRKIVASLAVGLTVLVLPATAFAHVIVTPKQADVGEHLVFNVSVPNERQVPVSSVRLMIPSGVSDVLPTANGGWAINTTSSGGSDSEITSITWTGNIPVGQRQDFSFSAQVPAQAGQLDWKAYQTYADGTVVSWDQKPTSGSDKDDDGASGPYSITTVKNDLSSADSPSSKNSTSGSNTGPYILSGLALLVALAALARPRK